MVQTLPFQLLTREALNSLSQNLSAEANSPYLACKPPALTEDAAVISDALIQHCGHTPHLPVKYPYPERGTLFHRWIVYDAMVSVHKQMVVGVLEALQYWLSDPDMPVLVPLMPAVVPTTEMSGPDLVLDAFRNKNSCALSCIRAASNGRPALEAQREHNLVSPRIQLLGLFNALAILPNFPDVEAHLWQIR